MSAFCSCYQIINIFHSFNRDKKTYAVARFTCERAALNGFKPGRLVEPKTQSFNDKVYAETNIVFGQRKPTWIGISAKGGSHDPQPWVYTSSGTEIVFKNWLSTRVKRRPNYCAYLNYRGKGKWSPYFCHIKSKVKLSFICEFV